MIKLQKVEHRQYAIYVHPDYISKSAVDLETGDISIGFKGYCPVCISKGIEMPVKLIPSKSSGKLYHVLAECSDSKCKFSTDIYHNSENEDDIF